MAPDFSRFSVLICAETTKRLRRNGFPFDRLITPTPFLSSVAYISLKENSPQFRGELLFQLYNAFTKYLFQQIRYSLRRLNRSNHQKFCIHISEVDVISSVADQLCQEGTLGSAVAFPEGV